MKPNWRFPRPFTYVRECVCARTHTHTRLTPMAVWSVQFLAARKTWSGRARESRSERAFLLSVVSGRRRARWHLTFTSGRLFRLSKRYELSASPNVGDANTDTEGTRVLQRYSNPGFRAWNFPRSKDDIPPQSVSPSEVWILRRTLCCVTRRRTCRRFES